ncbi:hypothetical protein GOP47_0023831 [Adiantum capillus-veneris]|uniref:USP domain-containing protein n=1 Tax=Adiantum capillus-veneris TaxID=13818 RepID=A0A9D4U491_ADICA|nr:hypothetical protein GOP47_0023831 [Adiantum capillus-veneris]
MNCDHLSMANSNASSSDFGMRRGWRVPSTWGSDGKVCNPCSLFDAICAKAPRFRGFQQQDSHELLRYLLEGLNLEESGAATNLFTGDYRKVISTSFSKVLGQNGHSGDSEAAEEDKEHGKASKPSNVTPTLVESVFGGQLSSTVHCLECGHISVVYEAMLDLSLQIPTRQIPKKRQECEEQRNLNLPGGRSEESLQEDTKCEEQDGVLETQETLIASTLRTSASTGCLLRSSLSAQSDHFDSTLAIGDEPPKAGFPSSDPDCWNSRGSFAEDIQHSTDSPENTFSTNDEACIHSDLCKSGSDSSTLELSIDLNASKINTRLCNDVTFNGGVSSGLLQSNMPEGVSSAAHSCELVQGKSGISPLPYEPLATAIGTNEKGSDFLEYAATECNFHKLSCTEGKDLASSVLEENNGSCSQHLETVEALSGQNEAFKGHQEVSEHPNLMNFGRETICEASDKVKDALGSEQFTDSEDTAVPLSLEVCLADFIKSELLCGENAWECAKCSRLVEGTPSKYKSKVAVGHLSNELIKCLGDDLAESRVEKVALADAEALSRASSIKFEANFSVSAIGNDKVEQTQSDCANSSKLEEKCSVFEGEDNHKIIAQAERTCDSQILLTEKSVISHPLLNKHEQPEGNGLSHTCSKMLPNLKMERLSFFSNLFFKAENHKVKNDQQDKLVKRQATKKLLICKVPLVLTVHLKRFAQDVRGRLNKLSGHVAFSEYLNLRSFLDPRSPDYDDCVYQLVGIVEHGGTMRGGHYVAYVRGPNSDEMSDTKDHAWYHISDSIVSKCTLQDVLGREAYLLFYERHNVKKEG